MLSLLRKRVFNVAVALVGAIGVASYVQAVLLERLPLADGHVRSFIQSPNNQMIASGPHLPAILLQLQ